MRISRSKKSERGMTLIELLVVLVIVGFVMMYFLSQRMEFNYAKARVLRIQCVNNLKQVGLAYHVWAGDQTARFPMEISETNGGTMEFTTGPNAFRHYLVMSNELSTPKVLNCPADSDHSPCANFAAFNNSNISYFVGVDARETNVQMILSGDHNITNGTPIKNGTLDLTISHPSGWTAEVHRKLGNVSLADGSVQQVSITGLQTAVANTGFATNRLQMPILGP